MPFHQIEQLERRWLLSGYKTLTIANFETVGLKNPTQTLVRDSAGDIFGIARGGANNDGAVWEIPFTTKVLTIAAAFDGTDGDDPSGGLTIDTNGNIFGVCSQGGASKMGTLWELPAGQSSIMLLGSFDSSTGPSPSGQLYVDPSGNIFGASQADTLGPDYGNIWEYNATTQTIADLADFQEYVTGANPYGGVVSDGKGNLYGTAYNGGSNDDGTVWKYQIGSGTITLLGTFNGDNGANPQGGIAIDSSGDLFGTSVGSTNSDNQDNVWEVAAGSDTIQTLAFFPVVRALFFYGASPESPVSLDSNGNVIGAAEFGGTAAQGAVFSIHPGTNQLTDLHSFAFAGGHDPDSSLVFDSAGDIFGTTQLGGPKQDGTAFEMIAPGNVTPTHVAFTVQPVNTGANGQFTANVQVSVEGAGNQVAAKDSSAVTLSIAKGPTAATLGGTITADAVDGVATFTGLSLDAAGTFTLKATDAALKPATSKSFMVPTTLHLSVAQQPSNTSVGAKMTPPIAIDVEDQFGNPVLIGHSAVKLAIQSGPALGKLRGATAPMVKGVATFKTLTASTAGAYVLTASDGTAAPLTLDAFTVSAATAIKAIFSTQPLETSEGTPFGDDLDLLDSLGSIAANGKSR